MKSKSGVKLNQTNPLTLCELVMFVQAMFSKLYI